MSLLPPDATLTEMLEECVAAFRGRGLGLSPKDLLKLSEWLDHGIPPAIVARGIAAYANAARWDRGPSEATFFSLNACHAQVLKAWEWHRVRSVGSRPVQETPVWHRELHALQAQQRFHEAAARLCAFWESRPAPDRQVDQRRSRAIPWLLLRTLPYSARRMLMREARDNSLTLLATGTWNAKPSPSSVRSASVRRVLGLPAL
jgi:hypothetical protein